MATTRKGQRAALRLGLALALLAAALGVACSGASIPNTVQRGGTIVLPLVTGKDWGAPGFGDNVFVPGYGSDMGGMDPQLGQLVVWLYRPGAPGNELLGALEVQWVVPVGMPIEAEGAESQGASRELLLIANVPLDAPLGTVEPRLFRIGPDGSLNNASYQLGYDTIAILEETVSYDDYNDQPQVAQGTPAVGLLQGANGSDAALGGFLGAAVPGHSFGLTVRDPASSNVQKAHYSKISVSYPSNLISIEKVVPRDPAYVQVWHDDDENGVLTIEGVARRHPIAASMAYRVTFGLKTTDPLELTDLQGAGTQVIEARDLQGAPLGVSLVVNPSW